MAQVYDDQYDPSVQDYSSETKSLAEVIRIAMDQASRELNVWLPCQVIAVRDNQTVDVQPCITELFRAQGVVRLPVLQSVPVEHPRGKDYWVKLPVAVGDYGRVVFCDRSLDNWLPNGGVVDSDDPRAHDLSDGVFVPGLSPVSQSLPGAATDLVVHNGSAEIYIQKNGKFKITNGSNELLDQLASGFQTLSTASTLAGGPFTPDVVNALNAIVSAINSLKGT